MNNYLVSELKMLGPGKYKLLFTIRRTQKKGTKIEIPFEKSLYSKYHIGDSNIVYNSTEDFTKRVTAHVAHAAIRYNVPVDEIPFVIRLLKNTPTIRKQNPLELIMTDKSRLSKYQSNSRYRVIARHSKGSFARSLPAIAEYLSGLETDQLYAVESGAYGVHVPVYRRSPVTFVKTKSNILINSGRKVFCTPIMIANASKLLNIEPVTLENLLSQNSVYVNYDTFAALILCYYFPHSILFEKCR